MKSVIALFAIFALASVARSCPDETNCRECDYTDKTKAQCNICTDTFFNAATSLCTAAPTTIKYCREYATETNGTTCMRCDTGYTPTVDAGASCQACKVAGCGACDSDVTVCDACTGGRAFVDGACSNSETCKYANCDMCDWSDVCHKCKPDFALIGFAGKCIAYKGNCSEVDEQMPTQCRVCDDGFYVTKLGDCEKNTGPDNSTGTPIWKILLIILIIALLLAAAYFGYMKYRNRRDTTVETIRTEYVAVN